jgi:hypothetical protein
METEFKTSRCDGDAPRGMGIIDAEQFDSLPAFKSIGQTCTATGHRLHCDAELFGLLFLNADAAFANHFRPSLSRKG